MQWFFTILTDNPAIRAVQVGLFIAAVIAIYLIFFATRDILLRTRSLFYQIVCIAIVAVLPIAGFFIYLLIRPSSTIRERELQSLLEGMLDKKKESKESGDK